MRFRLASFSLLAFVAGIACAPGGGRVPPSVPLGFGATSTPLSEIQSDPGRFLGKTINTAGRVENLGVSSGARWIELADAGGGRVVFLIGASAEAGALEGTVGRDVELQISIDGTATLENGRRAIRMTPLQVLSSIRRFETPQEIPTDLSAEMEKASEAMRRRRATMFRDPGAEAEEIRTTVRYLDPGLRKPFFERPGPARVERLGAKGSHEYVYSASSFAADGARMDTTCRFRVEGRDLRSVSYEEVQRKPDGSPAAELRLDFLNGEALDKVSGKSFRWPRNIYAAPCLPFAIRGFPIGEAIVVDFFLWSDYDPFTAMFAALDGPDTVPGPTGPRPAVRVRMNLNEEKIIRSLKLPMPQAYDMARDIIGQLQPEDSLFWIAAAPPHDLLRAEGPMGAPGTTRGIMERVSASAIPDSRP